MGSLACAICSLQRARVRVERWSCDRKGEPGPHQSPHSIDTELSFIRSTTNDEANKNLLGSDQGFPDEQTCDEVPPMLGCYDSSVTEDESISPSGAAENEVGV